MSVPAASVCAGIVKLADPVLSVDVATYVPLESVMDPVGVPLAPVTATVTPKLTPVVMLLLAGVTVTVDVAEPVVSHTPAAFATLATLSDPRPVARSKPSVAPYPDSVPTLPPVVEVQSLGMIR